MDFGQLRWFSRAFFSAVRFRRRRTCSDPTGPLSATQDLFRPDYAHVVYNVSSNAPVRVYGGKIALDLTTRDRWRQVLGELRALGVDVTTPLTSYGSQTIYPTEVPGLKQCPGWAERGLDGLQMLLDTCNELGIECYPAVWLFRAATPQLSAQAMRELVQRYGGRPAFKGIVPPVEANPQGGFESDDFVALARLAKQLKPGLTVMDYPNGPFGYDIMQTIIERSLSGAVDIENVQFHPSDQRWDGDFLFARGMFHLVRGLCPGVRSIVHTHYKYGGGMRWIELDDLYRVRQAATITATPHGTSIYSFLHSMWGQASSKNLDDPLPRRLAWYQGILAVQRMVPYYQGAIPANAVAIMVPQYVRESSLTLLARTYVPLARRQIGVHCFVNELNMGTGVGGIVVPDLPNCSPRQLRLLQQFVAAGGAVCILPGPGRAAQAPLSPRARRILGLGMVREWEPAGLDPDFAQKAGLNDATGEVTGPEQPKARYGKGTIFVVPKDSEGEVDVALVDWVGKSIPERTIVQGSPEGFTIDRWHKSDAVTSLDIIMLMGTRRDVRAKDVKITVPRRKGPSAAYLLTPDRIEKLATRAENGRVQVTVPELCDEFNAVILTNSTYPFLVPEARLIRCKVGDTVTIRFSLWNALKEMLKTTVHLKAPQGWGAAKPSSWPVEVAPGDAVTGTCALRVPEEAERRPYFARLECSGLVQRIMLFPEDGSPQVFSDLKVSDLPAPRQGRQASGPPPTIGDQWLQVLADDTNSDNVVAHRPGVCFLPGKEWDQPAMHDGKMARYGERLPRLAAPNFIVNDPPDRDIEVRLIYWTQSVGVMHVYDGRRYHEVAKLADTGRWATVAARVPRAIWDTPRADRGQYPGKNIMFDVDCPSVYVHKIEVRGTPQNAR